MLNLSNFTKSFVKATKGTYQGSPRIYNIDQNKYIYGYAEINDQATSPFSRIKVHKGLFTCSRTDVVAGDLVQDRVDNHKYIVMSIKDKLCGEASTYFDCALYYCNTSVTISRFSKEGARDTFGRPIVSTATPLYTDIPVMTDTKNLLTTSYPDKFIETDKVNIYIQAKYLVNPEDRLITADGDMFVIETIDRGSLNNILILKVNKDDR